MSAALCVMTGRDDGGVIEAIELTTRRRGRRDLEAVSFQVRPGQVTGLLGLPGAGKTAVVRRMLQLDRGGGRTLYDGRPFRALAYPMRSVGVLLDPLAVHPGRTVAGHLRLALSADPECAPAGRRQRIEAVLDVVGLGDQARTRIFELTEGMTVRLGLAQALLGDPQALLLDEPEHGLEPEGRPWLAALLRAYAAQGRCVLVTGQSTDAMLGYADRVLVLDSGRLVGQRTARQAARELAGDCVIVRTPLALRLAAILVAAGAEPTQIDGSCLEVRGLDRARIGDLAFRNEVPLHELSVRKPGEDPVIAMLEACRKPPAVVPVQTPPTGQVPETAPPAGVRMPFDSGLRLSPAETESGGAPAPVPDHVGAQRDPGETGAGAAHGSSPDMPREEPVGGRWYGQNPMVDDSALLSVSVAPRKTSTHATATDVQDARDGQDARDAPDEPTQVIAAAVNRDDAADGDADRNHAARGDVRYRGDARSSHRQGGHIEAQQTSDLELDRYAESALMVVAASGNGLSGQAAPSGEVTSPSKTGTSGQTRTSSQTGTSGQTVLSGEVISSASGTSPARSSSSDAGATGGLSVSGHAAFSCEASAVGSISPPTESGFASEAPSAADANESVDANESAFVSTTPAVVPYRSAPCELTQPASAQPASAQPASAARPAPTSGESASHPPTSGPRPPVSLPEQLDQPLNPAASLSAPTTPESTS